jgi:hypothetical protein
VVSDNVLVSPAFVVASAEAQLTFRNQYVLESGTSTGYDGAVLEIKIGAGAYTDILAAGGSFESGGYDKPISSSYSNPLAGRPAWTGNSGGYRLTTVNLPPAALGQTVQLRWRLGTDTSIGGAGQRIDSITLRNSVTCADLTPNYLPLVTR